ncbi:Phasin protein [Rhodobacteraceae bacterium THAF1]|uniref:phasin family protein n=1 Tax=Palleronia sp. THAF1 TaxID=2587842 RepID=UPI000F3F6AE5|nr:phasin family protein [Palleronia sp. THAF1]QFU08943.1 Phasin protein [Palleronia sp. THAF1]VDC24323.1 Phasin protein [Rhodobacteraceae bacterium THAF1]
MAQAPKNPFDMSQMFAMFEPDRMKQMWNPQAMMQMFQQPQAQMFDMEQVIRANQRNFEAMSEANQSAAEAYKDLLDKQMEIFEKMTHAARQQYEWADENAGPDAMKSRTAAMNEAVEESLTLMRKMADNAREANEEAYRSMTSQIEESVSKVEQTAKKAAKKS